MRRSTKHLVMAREDLPAQYRPANQLRLVRDRAVNGTPSDPEQFMPGLGQVQSGNGRTDNGLGRPGSMQRFQHALAEVTAQREQQRRGGWLRPGAPKVPTLKVVLAWAGNSIAAERQKIQDAYGLVPLATWNKREAYTTTAWGGDVQALHAALSKQPIVSVVGIERLDHRPQLVAHDVTEGGTDWEFVATIRRPAPNERWVITRRQTPSGTRFATTLYRKEAGGETEVIRSDNLASEATAREYIRATEVRHGDYGAVGRPKRVVFWNTIQRRLARANAAPRPANPEIVPYVPIPGGPRPDRYQPSDDVTNLTPAEIRKVELDGLSGVAVGPLAVAALAIGGFLYLTKHR
jgi:hypothetical protein